MDVVNIHTCSSTTQHTGGHCAIQYIYFRFDKCDILNAHLSRTGVVRHVAKQTEIVVRRVDFHILQAMVLSVNITHKVINRSPRETTGKHVNIITKHIMGIQIILDLLHITYCRNYIRRIGRTVTTAIEFSKRQCIQIYIVFIFIIFVVAHQHFRCSLLVVDHADAQIANLIISDILIKHFAFLIGNTKVIFNFQRFLVLYLCNIDILMLIISIEHIRIQHSSGNVRRKIFTVLS